MDQNQKLKVSQLVRENKLSEALNQLAFCYDDLPKKKEIIILQSHLYELKKKENLGTLDIGEINIQYNKIRSSILSIMDNTEPNLENKESCFFQKNKLLYLIAALMLIFFILYFLTTSINIGINGDNNQNNEVIIKK